MSVTAVLGNLICSGIILLVIGFGVFNFIKYLIGLVRHPEVKQKFPFLAFVVTLFFVISIVFGIAMSISAPSTPAPVPTRTVATRLSPTPTVQAAAPISTDNAACLKWDKVTASMDGKEICVYGDVVDYREVPNTTSTYFYFGSQDQFFFVASDVFFPDFNDGDCAQAEGVVKLNTYKVPYIKLTDLYECGDPSFVQPTPPAWSIEAAPTTAAGSSIGACPNGCVYPKAGCHIKGNVSVDTGEKNYHVLGQELYSSTTINASDGERWFCTEDEARAAGWRKAEN